MISVPENFVFYENSLYIKNLETLVIADLHIGLEYELNEMGIQIPLYEEKILKNRLEKIFKKFKPKITVLNGDILHSFSSLHFKIKNEFKNIINYISKFSKKLIFLKGSHDTFLEKLVIPEDFKGNFYNLNDILFTHGNQNFELNKIKNKNIHYIILGHEHPCVELNMEKFHCFLYYEDKIKKLNYLILPAFNPLIEGVILNDQVFISPIIEYLSPNLFIPIITYEEELLIFPSINKIKELEWDL